MRKFLRNYHTHTERCHHASGSDEEYVLAAIDAGLVTLGFSDHTPYPMKDGFVSWFRQSEEEADNYVQSVLALREKYKDKIEILLGFETEYYPNCFDALMKLYRKYPIDYIILGQHCIGDEQAGGITSFNAIEDEDVLAAYVSQVCEGISRGVYSYVAHPDCVNFVGDEAVYRRHMGKICESAKLAGIPLELNLWGAAANRHYPAPAFWEMVGENGNEVIVGSDAHTPNRVALQSEYDGAMQSFSDKYSLNVIDELRLVCVNR